MFAMEKPKTQKTLWALLNKLLEEKCLAYVDHALAAFLLKDVADAREEIACFICHLSMAARKGHLCVSVDNEFIYPPPEELWKQATEDIHTNTTDLIHDEELKTIRTFILAGAALLPSFLLTEMDRSESLPGTPICRHGTDYYFQRFWIKETQLIHYFKGLIHATPALKIEKNEAAKQVNPLVAEQQLLPEQSQAILKACEQSLTIICGGPGTGKTYTAAHLIKVLWNALTDTQKQHFEIALAAPTGKAASNLQKSLSRVMNELNYAKPLKAKTLHSLLGIRRSNPNHLTALHADLILIDECSMIDIDLMTALFSAIKPGARLILLGDFHQLPSVEAGGVFNDMVHHLRKIPSSQPAELCKCLRAELKDIVDFAAAIHSNTPQEVLELLSKGIQHHEINQNLSLFKKELLHHAAPYFEINTYVPKEIMEAFNRFRILSPLRKGVHGVDALNELFAHHFEKAAVHKNTPFAAPIILTKSDANLELFNGETGVLIRINLNGSHFQEGDYAIFPGDTPDSLKQIPAVLLPQFEYAYCLSVHKSQGSEFDHVLLMLPERAELFGREILYTAVTRAKKKLEIWGSENTLIKTLLHQSSRHSGFQKRMN